MRHQAVKCAPKAPFQLQIIASIRERPLQATWATIAAPTLPAAAVQERALLFVIEGGLRKVTDFLTFE